MKLNVNIKKVLIALIIIISAVNISFAAEISTEAKLQYNKGVDMYRIGRYDEAIDAFKKAIDEAPDYIDAYYNLGSILEFIKQDDAALAVFRQIMLRKPTDYEAAYKAAAISLRLGQTAQAKSYLSLIPPTSIVNSKAQQLAASMKTDMQTIKHEQRTLEEQSQKFSQSNGTYENLGSPTGMTTDKNGNLYVAGFSDNAITKISPDGQRRLFVKDSRLNGPIGLECDAAGNIYVANYNANNVLKISSTGVVSVLIGNIQKPYCLHIAEGLLFISAQGSNSVVRYKLR